MGNSFRAVPKFRIEFTAPAVPDDPRLTELKHWCSVFHRSGLAPLYEHGSFGNLSFRDRSGSNGFFITASGLQLKADLSNESFVKVSAVDLDRQLITAAGSLSPSSESMLHYAIYKGRKEINAVFHGHSPAILANCERLKLPTTVKEEPYGSLALVKNALVILGGHNFVILKDHGFISLGKTMQDAGEQTLAVLKSCFIA